MKTKIVPFDLETAKKIQAGEIEGRIVAENMKGILFPIRIICYDAKNMFPIVGLALDPSGNEYTIMFGKSGTNLDDVSIHIELPEEAPKHEFKPFDKVLVRGHYNKRNNDACWYPALFGRIVESSFDDEKGTIYYKVLTDIEPWRECIPYEGNEHLLGTTNKPKEE